MVTVVVVVIVTLQASLKKYALVLEEGNRLLFTNITDIASVELRENVKVFFENTSTQN